MRRVVRDVAEKWLSLVFIDEGQRVVGEIVGDEAFSAHWLAVAFEGWIEIFAPMTGGEAVVFFKAPGVRMIRPLAAVMPFSKGSGRVACRPKRIGDGFLVEVQ